jgi:hypothetical protein
VLLAFAAFAAAAAVAAAADSRAGSRSRFGITAHHSNRVSAMLRICGRVAC